MTDTPEAVRLASRLLVNGLTMDEEVVVAALLRRIPELEAAIAEQHVENAEMFGRVFQLGYEVGQLEDERDQLRAELERVRVPEGWRLVPAEPTEAMLDRAVAFALNVHLSSGYGWTQYMRDLWGRLLSGLAAAPTPPHADQKGQ